MFVLWATQLVTNVTPILSSQQWYNLFSQLALSESERVKIQFVQSDAKSLSIAGTTSVFGPQDLFWHKFWTPVFLAHFWPVYHQTSQLHCKSAGTVHENLSRRGTLSKTWCNEILKSLNVKTVPCLSGLLRLGLFCLLSLRVVMFDENPRQ